MTDHNVIPLAARILVRIWWTDTTNIAGGWHDEDALVDFATNDIYECSNVGWLTYEDESGYVVCARMTNNGEHVGLMERIPKSAVTRIEEYKSVGAE